MLDLDVCHLSLWSDDSTERDGSLDFAPSFKSRHNSIEYDRRSKTVAFLENKLSPVFVNRMAQNGRPIVELRGRNYSGHDRDEQSAFQRGAFLAAPGPYKVFDSEHPLTAAQ